ncbi:hypothetical protein H8356DRAFT_1029292 [Neocallimastix lanati (nom. inval.)]|uniref:Uncharacterized protein n=1 Tax=Neocallimastix californiae TaxID=1754190 RepID=A0A1Y2FT87_9FUNG|nr:hypothetical protein H8356DRAFT_1029292 [Neocallimastix sp. JGI-2020a]ORY87212.1 hypothetical protein LY90DRAFT_662936 [Neocallimastix californiae]|eukprot:ORY87212.1 hypothetical protein LY90DRAFT_662936 [Neocallimastix californiae]
MKFFYLLSYLIILCTFPWNSKQFYITGDTDYEISLPSKINGNKNLYIGHAVKDEDLDVNKDIKYKYDLKDCKFVHKNGVADKIHCKFTSNKDKSYDIDLRVLNGSSCHLDKNTQFIKAEFHASVFDYKEMKSEHKEVEMPLYLNPKDVICYVEIYNSIYFDFWTKRNCHFRSHIYTKGFLHYLRIE